MEADAADHVLSGGAPPQPFLASLGVNDLPHVWTAVEPLLRKACDDSRGEFTIERILQEMGVNDGVERWRLLAIVRADVVQAVMVVCRTRRGEQMLLDCLLAAGDHAKQWPAVDDEFDALAREWGCSSARIPHARKGWLKALPHWRVTGYALERKV